MTMLGYIVIALAVPIISSKAIGEEYLVPNDTKKCVNDLIEWCEGMKYPAEGGGLSMVSVTVFDPPDTYYRILCTVDSYGTNCTRNASPWLTCTNQNQLFYKSNLLTKDSVEGADNETCKTADCAFNDLFLQNLSYDNTTIKKEVEQGMEKFFKAMGDMQWQIEAMQSQMFNIFGGGFPFRIGREKPIPSDPYEGNQREKE